MNWKIISAAVLYVVLAFAVTGCSREAAPISDTTTASAEPALALVERLNGAGLESLAFQAAQATSTYGVLIKEHGRSEADLMVKREIAKALPAYQKRWNANLAAIYNRHFSEVELASLVAQGPQSPHASKFMSADKQVATEMRSASTPLLEQLVTESLTSALKGQ